MGHPPRARQLNATHHQSASGQRQINLTPESVTVSASSPDESVSSCHHFSP